MHTYIIIIDQRVKHNMFIVYKLMYKVYYKSVVFKLYEKNPQVYAYVIEYF